MFDALVFNPSGGLEFLEVRRNLVRIPEILAKLREAQAVWDAHSRQSLDFGLFISSDDATFLSNLHLKNLAMALIQIGLVDRLLKDSARPKILVGLSNGDSALRVIAGFETLESMVKNSAALAGPKLASVFTMEGLPVLAGVQLGEFSILKISESGSAKSLGTGRDFKLILKRLHEDFGCERLVAVGPGIEATMVALQEAKCRMTVSESISLDPRLGWFWSSCNDLALGQ
jgi:hypothetical protein